MTETMGECGRRGTVVEGRQISVRTGGMSEIAVRVAEPLKGGTGQRLEGKTREGGRLGKGKNPD